MNKSPSTFRRQSLDGDSRAVTADADDDRLAFIEDAIAEIRQTLDVQFQRIADMQAQLDHLNAKTRNR
jgi:hypothetical protein